MGHWAAITVLGKDCPGIVAGVTRCLFEHGCNLEDTSATRLRDAFAMILIARLPEPPRVADLQARLDRVAAELSIGLDLRDLGEEAPEPAPAGSRQMLSVYGADRPGIVYHVSAQLAALECNVTDVTTRFVGPAEAPIYLMMLEMTVPPSVEPAALDEQLVRLRQALNVDITLRSVDEETL